MEVKNNQDLLTNIFLERNLAVLFIVNRCELKRIELKTSVDRLGLFAEFGSFLFFILVLGQRKRVFKAYDLIFSF